MTQLITPNPDIACRPGYCLEYVRQTFGLPIRYGSATEAWNNSPSQHQDWNFPAGLWVPVYFAIDVEPNGHIALLAPDGSVFSSSDLGTIPHHHPSIADLIAYYAYWGKMQLTYLGWSEDVAGYPVVSIDSGSINFDSATPTPQEDTLSQAEVQQIQGFINAAGDRVILDLRAHIAAGTNEVEAHVNDRATAVVTAIFNTPIPNATGGTTTLGALIGWNDSHVNAIIDATKGGAPFDPTIVQKAVSAALANGVHVNITTN